jgi:hypothetical protein
MSNEEAFAAIKALVEKDVTISNLPPEAVVNIVKKRIEEAKLHTGAAWRKNTFSGY